MEIERRPLGFSEIDLPIIGVRASQPFNVIGKESQSDRSRLVEMAMARGIDFFSTSPDYGEAQRILAAGLTGRRHRATVMSTIRSSDIAIAYRQIDVSLHLFDGWVDLFVANREAASDDLMVSLERMRAVGEATAIGIECQTMDQLRDVASTVAEGAVDLISLSAALLLSDETEQLLASVIPPNWGIVAYIPDAMMEVRGSSLENVKIDVAWHRLTSIGDVLLKLAASDNRISSVAVPVRRKRDLDRIERIARSPALSQAEMAALRTG